MEIYERRQAPNATSSLVLGILSILFHGFLSLVFSIVGLILSKQGLREYYRDPDAYDGYGSLNAGRILSILGLIKSILVVAAVVVILAIFGKVLFTAGSEILEELGGLGTSIV